MAELREYKLMLLGDGGVGKSSLIVRYTHKMFVEELDPTIEDSYRKSVIIDDEAGLIDVLDTAPQEHLSARNDRPLRLHQGFLLLYDITRRRSFEELASIRANVQRARSEPHFPLVIVGTKCDLDELRVVDAAEAATLAEEWGAGFIETSSKSGVNVDLAFAEAVRAIRNTDSLKAGQSKKSSKCLTM
ncbi:Ras-1 [Thecamonas trahens ATCC 50062]|uniref:Ras-1 n=1 Tax=Thecamonas trahens ATCC 50062 TaxID=461836 RepID=A0A0L0DK95_THETB|nr:Ras-1 [Thecamonas trahens ATCC 50062]KNC52707.1 Ras-1 [Thecamonas trahens ATCC 50062]|eukprot:XP_013755027.1 Ras-1 [Thecamonas trahens ATCC 50062]